MSRISLLSFAVVTACSAAGFGQSPVGPPQINFGNSPVNALTFTSVSVEAVADSWMQSDDAQKLKSQKWIVRSVTRDGDTLPAQIGQKVGDVIEFRIGPDRFDMG